MERRTPSHLADVFSVRIVPAKVHAKRRSKASLGIDARPLKHFVDDAPSSRRLDGIRLGKTRCDDQGLPQGPGAAASPCARVERKHCAEGFPAFAAEKRPGN